MQHVTTWRNVYTGEVAAVCNKHEQVLQGGWSVSHGRHEGNCRYCPRAADDIDEWDDIDEDPN